MVDHAKRGGAPQGQSDHSGVLRSQMLTSANWHSTGLSDHLMPAIAPLLSPPIPRPRCSFPCCPPTSATIVRGQPTSGQ